MKNNLKYGLGVSSLILIMWAISYLYYDYSKIDLFLFADYKRYTSELLKDIYILVISSLFSYWLIPTNKIIFKPFFIVSLINAVLFFMFNGQYSEYVITPIYVVLVCYYNYKQNDR